MGKITICSLLWDANKQSKSFSSMYDESWVEKLYRGFKRNLTVDFDFVLYTDRPRTFNEPGIGTTVVKNLGENGYSDCIKPYEMNVPMILCGLDTVIMDNIDHLAEYSIHKGAFALPRDPYRPNIACNGVALVPYGMKMVYDTHDGENDMDHVREFSHVFIDDIFPGQVKSYKGHIKTEGWPGVRIVYFHGKEKPHELSHERIRRNWI